MREQRPSYNNGSWISSSVAVSRVKLVYYQAFALFYGLVGSLASVVMVNSSWTRRHIEALWKLSSPVVVFPPCDTSELEVGWLCIRRKAGVAYCKIFVVRHAGLKHPQVVPQDRLPLGCQPTPHLPFVSPLLSLRFLSESFLLLCSVRDFTQV